MEDKATCIDSAEFFDLTVGKEYILIRDDIAEKVEWIRVIDDSDEDFIYPKRLFMIGLASEIVQILRKHKSVTPAYLSYITNQDREKVDSILSQLKEKDCIIVNDGEISLK